MSRNWCHHYTSSLSSNLTIKFIDLVVYWQSFSLEISKFKFSGKQKHEKLTLLEFPRDRNCDIVLAASFFSATHKYFIFSKILWERLKFRRIKLKFREKFRSTMNVNKLSRFLLSWPINSFLQFWSFYQCTLGLFLFHKDFLEDKNLWQYCIKSSSLFMF